jgi:hypothetical protein
MWIKFRSIECFGDVDHLPLGPAAAFIQAIHHQQDWYPLTHNSISVLLRDAASIALLILK